VNSEFAKVSLTGHRAENQDRVEIVVKGPSALLIVVDGMGGHAEGARASEVTIDCVTKRFNATGQPVLDPQGFLISALAEAHDQVVELGGGINLEQRPRATCAVCLVQDQNAYWAHIGDSRIYQLRAGKVLHRSRDHSHVELLLHEGVIQEEEVNSHPMRNFVECCLGGDEPLPDMSISGPRRLNSGDVLLLCSDGLWSGVTDQTLVALAGPDRDQKRDLEQVLLELADRAVRSNSPGSDNTSAAVMRFNGVAA
jgi:serine/threonine protein phosphatase PrpC